MEGECLPLEKLLIRLNQEKISIPIHMSQEIQESMNTLLSQISIDKLLKNKSQLEKKDQDHFYQEVPEYKNLIHLTNMSMYRLLKKDQ
jgi:hypothetical protein